MTTLGKIGFAQSYTYFTWKNTRWELLEFMGQLLDWTEYYRPNFFANTPDILHEYLAARRPARLRGAARARGDALALVRHLLRLRAASRTCRCARAREEYLDSEKYEVKKRALDGPLLPLVATAEPGAAREPGAAAPRQHHVPRDRERAASSRYLKRTGDNAVIVVVNLDPTRAQEGVVRPAGVDRPAAGVPRARPARASEPTGRGTSAATTFASRPARATS